MSRFSAFSIPQGTYRVIRDFVDFDGTIHPPGETWRFLSHAFLPYDAGLTLFIQRDGAERSIRLQDYPDAQGPVIDNFHEYIERVEE